MDWLKNLFNSNPILALTAPSAISAFSFFGNLLNALSDGYIDGNEFHQLMMSASGFQLLILIAIMVALSAKDKENK